ncbi:MAG: hypothetical protein RR867_04305 [Ruthenibacterium sp.]
MANTNDAARERAFLSRRRKWRQLLGAVVCVLVVIGAISAVSFGVKMVGKAFDDTDEKIAYEERLLYLVALDPVPFATLSDANLNTLLNAAIWETIAGSNADAFEHDEVGALYLPTLDIDKTVAKLYGPDFKFTYETFEDRSLTYTYIPEKQAYLIPVTSAIADYMPKVTKIKREGDIRRVTVGYLSQTGTGGEFIVSANVEPIKYYDYLFKKDGKETYLTAIVDSETKAEAPANSAASAVQPESIDPQEALQNALSGSVPDSVASAAAQTPTASAPAASVPTESAPAASSTAP